MIRRSSNKHRQCSYCGSENHYAKGLCRNCYNRQRRNGSPEYRYPRIIKEVKRLSWEEELAIDIFGSLESTPSDFLKNINRIMEELDARDQTVLRLRYKKQMTLEECGKQLGVSKERIRQIQRRAMRKCISIMFRLRYMKHVHNCEEQ